MKKHSNFSAPFLLISLLLAACNTMQFSSMKVEIAMKPKANLEAYDEILITDFLITKETKGFNINKELKDYFVFEMEQALEKKTEAHDFSPPDEESFQNEKFWPDNFVDKEKSIIVTGSVNYEAETRKAVYKKESRHFEETFEADTSLLQRKFYHLTLNLFFIEAKTGKIIYSNTFEETKTYKNPNQTAYFAFFELIQAVKEKLLRNIAGSSRTQERYLIK